MDGEGFATLEGSLVDLTAADEGDETATGQVGGAPVSGLL